MEYKRFGNTVVVRMDKGEEIVEQVKQVALKENIKLAQVSALGATNDFEVGLFDTQKMWVCSKQMIRSILQMISAAALKSFL